MYPLEYYSVLTSQYDKCSSVIVNIKRKKKKEAADNCGSCPQQQDLCMCLQDLEQCLEMNEEMNEQHLILLKANSLPAK